jgi:hypothetical protein
MTTSHSNAAGPDATSGPRLRLVVWQCPVCQTSLPAISASRRRSLGIFRCPCCGASLTYKVTFRQACLT